MRDREPLHGLQDLRADALGVRPLGVGEDDDELLAAVARGQVERPAREAREHARNRLHRLVSGLVSVAIVVGLEVIDVRQQERDRLAIAGALCPGALQVLVETPPVVDAREPVLHGGLGKALAFEPGAAARMLKVPRARDADDVRDAEGQQVMGEVDDRHALDVRDGDVGGETKRIDHDRRAECEAEHEIHRDDG